VKQITQILVHTSPHADELLGLIILQSWGEGKFPGVNTAKVTPFSGGLLKKGDLPENVVAIGTGYGLFDEHGKSGNECAATLIAKELGVRDFKAIEKILKQTLQEDRNAAKVKNEIPSIVKILHMVGLPLQEVIDWYKVVYSAEYQFEHRLAMKLSEEEWQNHIDSAEPTTMETGYDIVAGIKGEEEANRWKQVAETAIAMRQEMFVKAKKHFQQNGKRQTLNTEDFGPLQIGFVELIKEENKVSQDEEFGAVMNSAARFCKIELFVQKGSEGNIQIFTDSKIKIDLTKLARNIRVAEAKKRGIKIQSIQTIAMEGTHPEVPMWHLLEGQHSMLFNGSLSATMIEPTVLTPGELLEIIKETFGRKEKGFHVDPMAFQPSRATRQLEGAFAK